MTTMPYVPPHDLLTQWLDTHQRDDDGRLLMRYEDVVDVLKAFISAIPVHEAWYLSEYPAVANLVRSVRTETAASHFRMHGYLEGRRPFADGWNGHAEPVPFECLKPRFQLAPARGGLIARMFREDFIALIKQLLSAVPVDPEWYRSRYPIGEIGFEEPDSTAIAAHFAEVGYFNGWLPCDVELDTEWYQRRYEHVRRGLELGFALDAKDHFLKMGYREACRPIPPS
jgi:hypothetical protein